MTRLCEICGAPIESSAGVCRSCGVSYEALDTTVPVTLGQPRWGVLKIAFPFEGRDEIAIKELQQLWRALEQGSFQKLAPTQLHLIVAGRAVIDLVGPYSTYKKLQEEFGDRMNIEFIDKSPAQIDELLASIPR